MVCKSNFITEAQDSALRDGFELETMTDDLNMNHESEVLPPPQPYRFANEADQALKNVSKINDFDYLCDENFCELSGFLILQSRRFVQVTHNSRSLHNRSIGHNILCSPGEMGCRRSSHETIKRAAEFEILLRGL